MAASNYAIHVGGSQRKSKFTAAEYSVRRRELALRGQELPQTKLLDIDVISIRSAARQRDALRKHISESLSNEALAKTYGVHVRTIEKLLTRDTWSHLA